MMEQREEESMKNPLSLLKRLLGYMLRLYRFSFFAVIVCIIGSSLATLRGTLFMRTLIDDYIIPLTKSDAPDFGPLVRALLGLAAVYVIGIFCSYAYNRIMVNITQGVMRKIRNDLFVHMESLPIKYFDTHAHGDIMSVYTNDVDTLRHLMSQSMPQLVNSAVTIVTTFISMVVLDIPLTVISVILVGIMILSLSKLSQKSAVFFVKQQKELGNVNGYIEEMMAGQKVVKVFCHEKKSLEEFKKRNEELRESAYRANLIANMIMPVNVSLGNISYVLCAIVGSVLALNGVGGLTLGTLVSFLTLNKNFTQPVTQISQQMNNVIMAMAGAGRVFDMLEEKPEEDNGYVELVNAVENAEARWPRRRNGPACGPGSIPIRRTGPSPTPGCGETWFLTELILAMMMKRWCCTILSFMRNPARKLPLWEVRVPERPRSPI